MLLARTYPPTGRGFTYPIRQHATQQSVDGMVEALNTRCNEPLQPLVHTYIPMCILCMHMYAWGLHASRHLLPYFLGIYEAVSICVKRAYVYLKRRFNMMILQLMESHD